MTLDGLKTLWTSSTQPSGFVAPHELSKDELRALSEKLTVELCEAQSRMQAEKEQYLHAMRSLSEARVSVIQRNEVAHACLQEVVNRVFEIQNTLIGGVSILEPELGKGSSFTPDKKQRKIFEHLNGVVEGVEALSAIPQSSLLVKTIDRTLDVLQQVQKTLLRLRYEVALKNREALYSHHLSHVDEIEDLSEAFSERKARYHLIHTHLQSLRAIALGLTPLSSLDKTKSASLPSLFNYVSGVLISNGAESSNLSDPTSSRSQVQNAISDYEKSDKDTEEAYHAYRQLFQKAQAAFVNYEKALNSYRSLSERKQQYLEMLNSDNVESVASPFSN